MTPEEAVERILREDPYLRSHYASGDSGVIGWVAGAAYAHLRFTDSPLVPMAELQRLARQNLGPIPRGVVHEAKLREASQCRDCEASLGAFDPTETRRCEPCEAAFQAERVAKRALFTLEARLLLAKDKAFGDAGLTFQIISEERLHTHDGILSYYAALGRVFERLKVTPNDRAAYREGLRTLPKLIGLIKSVRASKAHAGSRGSGY